MEHIPRWAFFVALLALLTGAGFWIAASRRRLRNEAAAEKLIAEGKMQISPSPADIQAIADAIRAKSSSQ